MRIVKTAPPPHIIVYRFESRAILDEFLAEAIRINVLERVVKRGLLGRKVKYIPIQEEKKVENGEELEVGESHS